MKKKDLLKHVGNMQQVANIRNMTIQEGRANNLRVVEVTNGPMQYLIMADKCLDIATLNYKGTNISFMAKPGLNGRNAYDTHGLEAQRSIIGGLFFTCGFENICAPYKTYPMHGRMRTTPAEHICSDAFWQDDTYVLKVSGEMREAELFGENLVLRREIVSKYGSNRIEICDKIINEGFRQEPMMLMYHCNFGYPLLQEGTELVLPTKKVTPREKWSANYVAEYCRMPAPMDNMQEQVFLHDLASDEQGNTFAAIVNRELQLGVRIEFNVKQLPWFMEWKSISSGDYVVGLEPSNSCVYGRTYHEKRGNLHMIHPQEEQVVCWSFTILDGASQINSTEEDCNVLLTRRD